MIHLLFSRNFHFQNFLKLMLPTVVVFASSTEDRWMEYKTKEINLCFGVHPSIDVYIFVPTNDIEDFVLTYIRLTEKLSHSLHNDKNLIDDICDWLHGSNFKMLRDQLPWRIFL